MEAASRTVNAPDTLTCGRVYVGRDWGTRSVHIAGRWIEIAGKRQAVPELHQIPFASPPHAFLAALATCGTRPARDVVVESGMATARRAGQWCSRKRDRRLREALEGWATLVPLSQHRSDDIPHGSVRWTSQIRAGTGILLKDTLMEC